MICNMCGGLGIIEVDEEILSIFPCEQCGGCGIAYCCEGLQEQPEETTEE